MQPLRWRCVERVIHHERDVREEQPGTDLRIGQIGHGLGPRAFGGPAQPLLWELNINLKFVKLRRGITSQFTLKRAKLQMSTLDSHQYNNNTTILCIWAWDAGRLYEIGYRKRMKKKKWCLIDVQFYTDKKLATMHDRQTLPNSNERQYFQYWILRLFAFTRFPANWDCLLKLYMLVKQLEQFLVSFTWKNVSTLRLLHMVNWGHCGNTCCYRVASQAGFSGRVRA